MDDDILKTVHSIFGKSVQIVDCEKTSSVRQEEVLLINGIPVTLAGHDGDAIKSALLTGQVPSVELLNQLLYQAGILRQPVQLETSLSVNSSMVTTQEVSVTRGGQILDGHTSETKEDHVYNSSKKEIWQPVVAKPDTQKIAYTATLQGTADDVIPSCSPTNGTAPIRGLTFTIADQMLRVDSADVPDYYYNNKGNERVLQDGDDDDDDDENDEYGELYVLNPQLTPSSPFANRLPPIRNATSNDNCAEDISRKYVKAIAKSLVSGEKASALNCDPGHDTVFNSASQQTAQTPLQQSPTSNTVHSHSTSSSYDFISSDEVHFDITKERTYADIQNREPSQISKSSNNKNVKSPNLGKKPSMSSSSCVSAANPSSSSAHQSSSLQHASAGNINASDVAAAVPSSATTTSAISITSVENGLVFRDGNLISGLLGSLIAHMVPSSQYYPDRSFIFSFLLSARLFIRPHELLSRVSEIWESQQQLQHHTVAPSHDAVDDSSAEAANISYIGRSQQMYPPQFADEQSRQKAIKSAQNCIRLLAEWIDTFPYDFRDERLMQHVRVLARKCVYIDNSLGRIVSNILQSLVQRLTVLEKYEEFLQTLAAQENNDSGTTTEDLATHFKMFSSDASPECHTNLNAAGSTSSNEREDAALAVEVSVAVGTVGIPRRSLSSSYNTAGQHHHQSIHLHSHQNSHHQSDSSSNSVNTLGPGGSGGGINIGSCTSSGSVNNGAEISGICDLCPNAALLAHQLTHIELERLSHIGPEEFVQAFAKENHLESFSDMKKTRNLESYVQWFNRLSYFTATEIVKYPKKKQRVRVIEFWIETARECFNIGNFNSLMAIIAGLNLSPISRLKKTWSKVQLAKFSVLEHQMDPTSNFNSYRSTLKAAMWRSEGATNERERIIIPFFSLLVKDLYFLNEGCSNRLPNGHINFEKFWQLAKQVMEFNTWKKVTCPFEKLPKVIMFLQMSSVLNENTLSMASFECEPPENNQGRGRYKTLRSETRQQT